ncbi:hypothetical protein KKC17_03980 [Patescibacteria group bacterium]|nr:hypothetical protein [Patescibacteria group bacterium]
MLEQLFGSRTRVKLLKFFLENQDSSFYVRELTRKIDEQLNSVRRELANLTNLGMITHQQKNDKKFYQLSPSFVLNAELKALLTKSQLLIEQDLIKRLKESGKLRFLALTGHFTGAKNMPTDIIIVGRVDKTLLNRIIQRFQKEVNREINYTVLSTREYNERRSLGDKFLVTILNSNKVVVVDDINQED